MLFVAVVVIAAAIVVASLLGENGVSTFVAVTAIAATRVIANAVKLIADSVTHCCDCHNCCN